MAAAKGANLASDRRRAKVGPTPCCGRL